MELIFNDLFVALTVIGNSIANLDTPPTELIKPSGMLKNTEDSKDKSTNYKQRMLSFLYGLISLLIRYFVIACLNHGKTRPQSYAQEEEKFESSRFVLREKLRHQFKNHIEKWTDKEFPLFPWKTLLHVVLIGLVTAQVSSANQA